MLASASMAESRPFPTSAIDTVTAPATTVATPSNPSQASEVHESNRARRASATRTGSCTVRSIAAMGLKGGRRSVSRGREELDGIGLALEWDWRSLLPGDKGVMVESAAGVGGDQHIIVGRARGRFDSGRRVHGIADHSEVEPATATDRPDHHCPRVDANTHTQIAAIPLPDARSDLKPRPDRAVGVVRQLLGGSEYAKESVADELVGVTAVLEDDRNDDVIERV